MHGNKRENLEIPSTDTSAYCQARSRLPEKLLEKLFCSVAQELVGKVTPLEMWCGRHVKVIDGSTVSMPDTPLNQSAYPQPSSQKAGCGFPIAKIGVLFSLATGTAVALVIDVLNTHDIKLARKLFKFLNKGDVLLGDRASWKVLGVASPPLNFPLFVLMPILFLLRVLNATRYCVDISPEKPLCKKVKLLVKVTNW